MTRPRIAWLLVACSALALGCTEQAPLDATQITARIHVAPEVRAEMASLRARSFTEHERIWERAADQTFAAAGLGELVDIGFVPRPGTSQARMFEVIVEALDAETQPLIEQRALVSFVPHQQRVLELWLYPCGVRRLGDVCESDPDCHGSMCLTCVNAECGATPTIQGSDLPPLDPTERDGEIDGADAGGMPDARRDASVRDGGTGPGSEAGVVAITCETPGSTIVCDDGNACNGVEVCRAASPDATPDGCVRGRMIACGAGETCDKGSGTCTSCMARADGDGDGAPSIACGGNDCNDSDVATTPGKPEVCDGKDNDCNGMPDDAAASASCMSAAPPGVLASCVGGRCEQRCSDPDADLVSGACVKRNDCPAVDPCAPGKCVDGVRAYTCMCPAGIASGGTACKATVAPPGPCEPGFELKGGTCVDIDECALPNVCTNAAHPCAQTQAPGYYCLGQRAEYPMPDGTIGGRTPPSYATLTAATTSIADDVIRDNTTGLDWQRQRTGQARTLAGAQRYCSELRLGGQADWRVPTRTELMTIWSPELAPSGVPPDIFKASGDGDYVWSTTVLVDVGVSVHILGEVSGDWGVQQVRDAGAVVRCVRVARPPGPGTPATRYDTTTAGVARDTRTGLTWQRMLVTTPHATADLARSYCDQLVLGGQADWRLPTFKELTTLDPVTSYPPVDGAAVLNVPKDGFLWTTTPGRGGSVRRYLFFGESSEPGYALCVR